MIELILNGKRIDTFAETVEITRQIANIGTISNRSADYTTSIACPMTANNMQIAENSQILGSTTQFPYLFHEASLIVDGNRIFDSGLARLVSVENDNFNYECFGSLTNLAKKWDGELARDLFMPELDTVYSVAQLTSENNTWEQGFIFPHIYWEEPHTSFLIRPCLFVAYVFRKLFESEGYTISNNIFSDFIFSRAILPFNGEAVVYGTRKFEEAYFRVDSGGGSFSITQFVSGSETVIVFASVIATFVITEAGRYEFNGGVSGLTEYFYTADPNSSANLQVEYHKNGVPFSGFTDCLIGDVIHSVAYARFDIYSDPLAPAFGGGTLTASWTGGFLELKNIDTAIGLSDELHFEQCLPAEWTKLDLFKSIVNQFGILVDIENVGRKANIFFFKEIYQNKGAAYDWTSKIDVRTMDMFFQNENYGKRNFFTFKADEVSGLNDWTFDITDETLQPEKEQIESYFACSAEINDIAVITQFLNGEVQEREQRILYVEKLGAAYPTARFKDLSFENYYFYLNGMFSKYKKIKVYAQLKANEILKFDFSKPIFYKNEYFYCESIEAFTTENELTILNLVRL